MPLDKTNVVDVVALNPARDAVILALITTGPWNDPEKTMRLQAKLKTYVAFAADGQLLRSYPEAAGKPVRIEIRSDHPLGETENRLVAAAQEHWCKPEGITLVVSEKRLDS